MARESHTERKSRQHRRRFPNKLCCFCALQWMPPDGRAVGPQVSVWPAKPCSTRRAEAQRPSSKVRTWRQRRKPSPRPAGGPEPVPGSRSCRSTPRPATCPRGRTPPGACPGGSRGCTRSSRRARPTTSRPSSVSGWESSLLSENWAGRKAQKAAFRENLQLPFRPQPRDKPPSLGPVMATSRQPPGQGDGPGAGGRLATCGKEAQRN